MCRPTPIAPPWCSSRAHIKVQASEHAVKIVFIEVIGAGQQGE